MKIKCLGRKLRRGFTREQHYQAGDKLFVITRLVYKQTRTFRLYGPLPLDAEFPNYGDPRRVKDKYQFGSNTSWKSAEHFLQEHLNYFLKFDDKTHVAKRWPGG